MKTSSLIAKGIRKFFQNNLQNANLFKEATHPTYCFIYIEFSKQFAMKIEWSTYTCKELTNYVKDLLMLYKALKELLVYFSRRSLISFNIHGHLGKQKKRKKQINVLINIKENYISVTYIKTRITCKHEPTIKSGQIKL